MKTFLLILILAAMIGAIVYYLYRCKKKGETCIGCPYAKQCGSKCSGSCSGEHEPPHTKHKD